MKHIFIVNPAAGKQDATEFVKKEVEKAGLKDFEIHRTSGPSEATEYIKSVLKDTENEYRFYSCGGDGTLNEVVNGVVGHDNASITVFPCGSGNDFIKYYGTKEDFSDIKTLAKAQNHRIDLLKTCGKYAINAVHFGFDTFVLKTMLKVRRKFIIGGRNAYTTGIVTALLKGMKTRCSLLVDGIKLGAEQMLLCTLCNGKYVGGAYKSAPKSVNDDGLIEVCHVNPISRPKFITLINDYKKGTHLDNPKFEKIVNYARAKKIEITAGKDFFISIDGELIKTENCTVEIIEKAVNFAVPEKLLRKLNLNKKTADIV